MTSGGQGTEPLVPPSAAASAGPLQASEQLDVYGDIPMARFGHTITLVSKTKVVLFGGATGDTGKYSMTGETYLFNILTKTWSKLNGKNHSLLFLMLIKLMKINILISNNIVKGVPPSPRAAHSSTPVEKMHIVVYGGATGGKLNNLYIKCNRRQFGLR
jgi:hypothetical protein